MKFWERLICYGALNLATNILSIEIDEMKSLDYLQIDYSQVLRIKSLD